VAEGGFLFFPQLPSSAPAARGAAVFCCQALRKARGAVVGMGVLSATSPRPSRCRASVRAPRRAQRCVCSRGNARRRRGARTQRVIPPPAARCCGYRFVKMLPSCPAACRYARARCREPAYYPERAPFCLCPPARCRRVPRRLLASGSAASEFRRTTRGCRGRTCLGEAQR